MTACVLATGVDALDQLDGPDDRGEVGVGFQQLVTSVYAVQAGLFVHGLLWRRELTILAINI